MITTGSGRFIDHYQDIDPRFHVVLSLNFRYLHVPFSVLVRASVLKETVIETFQRVESCFLAATSTPGGGNIC